MAGIYDERYENALWPDETAENWAGITAREWKTEAKNLLICAIEAYGSDVPDSIMVVVEDYFRSAFDAEDRERLIKEKRRGHSGDI